MITDYIPSGFEYVSAYGWTFDGVNKATQTITNVIMPGDSAILTIKLKVLANAGTSTSYTNIAEITSATDTTNTPRVDIDSTPDAIVDNDGTPVDDAINNPADQDDHDPAMIEIFDLALRKTLTTASPYTYGQTHQYRIVVFNQGNVTAQNIVVNDYIPDGYAFAPNNGWTGGPSLITTTIAGPLAAGDSVVLNLDLTFQAPSLPATNRTWINYSEIASAQDLTGTTRDDIDSDAGSNGTNENAIYPNQTGDDNITSITDTGIGSQDDHDPAGPSIFDLALRKTVATAGPYTYGQEVDFRIAVFNQGNIPADNVLITDYIPSGFEYVSAYGWTFDGVNKATQTITNVIMPGDSAILTIKLKVLANAGTSTSYTNIAEITSATDTTNTPRVDIDSTPDAVVDNDGTPVDDAINNPADQDDHDPAMIEIFDLALRKTLTTASPYTYGQTHQYRIVVFNQGNVTAQNIVVNDYIPDGYAFAPNNGWTGGPSLITTTIAGPLAAGDSVVLNLDLTFQAPSLPATNRTWINYSEIASAQDLTGTTRDDVDSDAGSNGTNENAIYPNQTGDDNITSITDTGIGSQDDHDPAGPSIFDLALRKTVATAGPYTYGQEVDFRIAVFNQGSIPADNVLITDYIPSGFEYVSAYGWTFDGVNKATQTITNVIMPGDSAILTIKLKVLANAGTSTSYTNIAEITSATDTTNTPRVDIDSTPDAIVDNDGTPVDDAINNPADQDDHDPAMIEIFDLALRKTLTTASPYTYGQTHQYRIVVFNQGNVTAQNIVVNDYIPDGYAFAPNNGWTGGPSLITTTIAGPLAAGDSVVLNLDLTFQAPSLPATNRTWINYSEIASAQDLTGTTRDDIDSDAGSNGTNENAIYPNQTGDDNITSITDTGIGSQDDHDPAGPSIFDLALRKTVATAGPYTYGQEVDFRIAVFNQGNVPADNVLITDYIPSGFEYVSAYGWTFDGVNKATQTITNVIMPGDSAILTIKLKVLANAGTSTSYTNIAEITSATDTTNTPRVDIDSTPDAIVDNDGTPVDDAINNPADQDDHDPAMIEIFDLALRKTLTTASPYTYGQTHQYRIVVFNQGNVTAQNIVVNDYIPDGYAFAPNNGWTGGPSLITTTIAGPLAAGDSVVLNLDLTFQAPSLPATNRTWINYSEIASAQDLTGATRDDVDSDAGSNGTNENAIYPNQTGDDNITSITDTGIGSQDDHDPAGPSIFDLALRKTVATAGPYTYGQEVDFRIAVFNQGNVPADNVLITDYIPSGFEYVSAYGWTFDGVNKATQTITNVIMPGDSSILLIKLKVLSNTGSATAYNNIAEITSATDTTNTPRVDIDSTPDAIVDNDGNPVDDAITDPMDQDDHDFARINVYDLALTKVVTTAGPYTYGQNINFRIRVYNQGTLPVSNTVVNDYIPVGYTYLSALNPAWTGVAPTVSYTYAPVVNPGDSFDVNLVLQLSRTDGGDRDWINYSEIKSFADVTGLIDVTLQEVDSDPNSNTTGELDVTPGSSSDDNITDITKVGDQDDHDPAGVEIFDLALRKNFIGISPVRYGDIIPFEITVLNQGNIAAANLTISDYIPSGFEFVVAANPTWTYNSTSRIASTTYPSVVAAGDSVKIAIQLKVNAILNDPDAWYNVAEITSVTDPSGVTRTDIDSDPDQSNTNDGDPIDDAVSNPNEEDDHDPAEIEIVDIALKKWVANEKPYYLPGEEVDFTLSIYNQGNVVSSSIGLKDYLPNGYSFVAANNPGWTLIGSNLEYNYNTRLYPGDSVQIHLKLIVIIPTNVSLSSWENYAEIQSVTDTLNQSRNDDDADSNPNSDTPYERAVHDNDPWDDIVDGNGVLSGPNEDEDDHDPEAVVVTAYLGDKVWKDLDGDGVQDQGEMPLQGVIVTIYDCATGALVQRDTTDINGNYGFEGLFGDKDYFVRFDASPLGMPNCAWTFKDRGNNDRMDSDVNASGITSCTRLDWGERDSTVDAGFVELAAYGDFVWHDRDADGQQEFGEEGIGGVTVTLYDAATNQIVRTAITDNNGYYFFDKLMPMQYYAKYTRPAGYGDTYFNTGSDITDNDVDGSNGAGTNATTYLSPGETDRTWDYGLYKCSCISGDVWYDLNKDGIYQDIENGINGVSVYLVMQ
ncbi:MAG: DUF11 domain-containing protein [Saprospiraceae bacterium]|nr:DUF11 domain-containing protein [Saprospiraceae bacterium]